MALKRLLPCRPARWDDSPRPAAPTDPSRAEFVSALIHAGETHIARTASRLVPDRAAAQTRRRTMRVPAAIHAGETSSSRSPMIALRGPPVRSPSGAHEAAAYFFFAMDRDARSTRNAQASKVACAHRLRHTRKSSRTRATRPGRGIHHASATCTCSASDTRNASDHGRHGRDAGTPDASTRR